MRINEVTYRKLKTPLKVNADPKQVILTIVCKLTRYLDIQLSVFYKFCDLSKLSSYLARVKK